MSTVRCLIHLLSLANLSVSRVASVYEFQYFPSKAFIGLIMALAFIEWPRQRSPSQFSPKIINYFPQNIFPKKTQKRLGRRRWCGSVYPICIWSVFWWNNPMLKLFIDSPEQYKYVAVKPQFEIRKTLVFRRLKITTKSLQK